MNTEYLEQLEDLLEKMLIDGDIRTIGAKKIQDVESVSVYPSVGVKPSSRVDIVKVCIDAYQRGWTIIFRNGVLAIYEITPTTLNNPDLLDVDFNADFFMENHFFTASYICSKLGLVEFPERIGRG